jgi:hypothetical protein
MANTKKAQSSARTRRASDQSVPNGDADSLDVRAYPTRQLQMIDGDPQVAAGDDFEMLDDDDWDEEAER